MPNSKQHRTNMIEINWLQKKLGRKRVVGEQCSDSSRLIRIGVVVAVAVGGVQGKMKALSEVILMLRPSLPS